MKNIKQLLIPFCALILISCGGGGTDTTIPKPPLPPVVKDEITQLWESTVSIYLQENLWLSEWNYDASTVLLLPLDYAFTSAHKDSLSFQNNFNDFFERYFNAIEDYQDDSVLRSLQFYYFSLKYLSYVSEQRSLTTLETNALTLIEEYVAQKWCCDTAWHWKDSTGFTGIKERLQWKLSAEDTLFNYFTAIIDEDFFIMSSAAELKKLCNFQELCKKTDTLDDVLNSTFQTFSKHSVFTETGGWLFQPGTWQDHKDYRYSGHESLAADLEINIKEGIPSDSSHYHRMPMWLQSYISAFAEGGEEKSFFVRSQIAFKTQFEDVILVEASDGFNGPRMNNFIDGWNGIYRYGYSTVGDNLGYGSYQLSGTLLVGSYPFLNSTKLTNSYQRLLDNGFTAELLETYIGPNTTRNKHALVSWPAYFENGFAELYLRLAISD